MTRLPRTFWWGDLARSDLAVARHVRDDEHDVDWLVEMNNTGGPVDVWAVDGVDPSELRESPEGDSYVPSRIAPASFELVRRDIPPKRSRPDARPGQADAAGTDTSTHRSGLFFEL